MWIFRSAYEVSGERRAGACANALATGAGGRKSDTDIRDLY